MIYRPPSEAESLILQVTIGCSHNKCTFCGSFKEKKFRLRSFDEVKEDVEEAKQYATIYQESLYCRWRRADYSAKKAYPYYRTY